MSIEGTVKLDPKLDAMRVDALRPVGEVNAPAGAEDTPTFRRLLESLEELAKEHRAAPLPADAGAVQAAMARADEGFTLAMDLRQQLEEAFRQRMS